MATNFLKIRNGITLKPTSQPVGENGDVYYDSTLNQFFFYQNGAWVPLPSGGGSANSPSWNNYNLSYADFATTATQNLLTLVNIPAKTMIHQVIIKQSTPFSGPGITDYTINVGDGGDSSKFAQPYDVAQAVSDDARSITQVEDVESFINPTNILVEATSVGANLDAATAGAVQVWLLTSLLS